MTGLNRILIDDEYFDYFPYIPLIDSPFIWRLYGNYGDDEIICFNRGIRFEDDTVTYNTSFGVFGYFQEYSYDTIRSK